jgi:hypothetical protein
MSINKGSLEQPPDPQTGDVAWGDLGQRALPPSPGSKHLRLAYSASEAGSVATVVQMKPENGQWRTPSKRQRGLLDRTVQAQIGRMLRDLFSDAAEEPVPERFARLLEALEAEEKRR